MDEIVELCSLTNSRIYDALAVIGEIIKFELECAICLLEANFVVVLLELSFVPVSVVDVAIRGLESIGIFLLLSVVTTNLVE